MALPLLAASFLIPFIPKIINAIAGSDDAVTARARLAPQVNDMVSQMVGRGMKRNEAKAAAEEAIQGAVKEATGKELLPAWADDAATLAGIATGGLALGGAKLVTAGAKLAGAKMGQAAAKTGKAAAKMEAKATRINDITKRQADPARAEALKAGPKKMTKAETASDMAEEAPSLRLPFSKSEFDAEKALAGRPAPTMRQAPQNSTRGDDVIEMPGEGAPRLPAPESAIRDAEFTVMPQSSLRLPFKGSPATPRRPAYQDIATEQSRDELLESVTPSELRALLARAGQ